MPPLMMRRRPGGGNCLCKLCVPPAYRKVVRGTYRAREDRVWREEATRERDQLER